MRSTTAAFGTISALSSAPGFSSAAESWAREEEENEKTEVAKIISKGINSSLL
jgi:hypothetical protein